MNEEQRSVERVCPQNECDSRKECIDLPWLTGESLTVQVDGRPYHPEHK